jgi:hypothetical protein
VLSLMFVFDETTNPTAGAPYLAQGRLIAGVLLPFLLLYVRGLEVALAPLVARAGPWLGWGCLAGIALVILGSELALALPVFGSAYNAYHLP